MNVKNLLRIFGLVSLFTIFTLIMSGCATHSMAGISDPPGFFKGLLHGFLIVFSFIASFFTDYQIYNFPNAGGWYDFGYLIGVSMFFGGSGAGACKKGK